MSKITCPDCEGDKYWVDLAYKGDGCEKVLRECQTCKGEGKVNKVVRKKRLRFFDNIGLTNLTDEQIVGSESGGDEGEPIER